jgi:hypothetical protein
LDLWPQEFTENETSNEGFPIRSVFL